MPTSRYLISTQSGRRLGVTLVVYTGTDALRPIHIRGKLPYPTSLGVKRPTRSLSGGLSRGHPSTPRVRESRTLHSRSVSRDSSARLQVRLRRLRFPDAGGTASQYSLPRCSRRGSGSDYLVT